MKDLEHQGLAAEVDWIARALHEAAKAYLEGRGAPALEASPSTLPGLETLEPEERAINALALGAGVAPEIFDVCIVSDPRTGRPFTVFGVDSSGGASPKPTVRTAAFLLGGDNLSGNLRALHLTATQQRLARDGFVFVSGQNADDRIAARVFPGRRWASLLGGASNPSINSAELLTTALEPADLVVPVSLQRSLDDLKLWLKEGTTILGKWGLGRHVNPGYRALFYGPSGTGKTLAAALIGKEAAVPVFRIDLSRVTSKWIGETEKNLASLFDQAEQQNAILFFDEADALFSKRTETKSANDRYANQEVAYLLQRIESARNVVILATNLRGNIDAAFSRRFQSVLYFPAPDAPARTELWRQVLSDVPLGPDVDIPTLAEAEEVTGATIVNAVRAAALDAEMQGAEALSRAMIMEAIKRERVKEGGVPAP